MYIPATTNSIHTKVYNTTSGVFFVFLSKFVFLLSNFAKEVFSSFLLGNRHDVSCINKCALFTANGTTFRIDEYLTFKCTVHKKVLNIYDCKKYMNTEN